MFKPLPSVYKWLEEEKSPKIKASLDLDSYLLLIDMCFGFELLGGTLGDGIVKNFLADLFGVLRFPSHTLFFDFFDKLSPFAFYLGLLINCGFYAFLIERTLYFVKLR
jgi:hypothetical protein